MADGDHASGHVVGWADRLGDVDPLLVSEVIRHLTPAAAEH
jgi:hypothetical protein